MGMHLHYQEYTSQDQQALSHYQDSTDVDMLSRVLLPVWNEQQQVCIGCGKRNVFFRQHFAANSLHK
jgi:hypothetical protein